MQKYNVKNFRHFFLKNATWLEGYKSFHFLLQRPLGWLHVSGDHKKLYRLNRKRCCDKCASNSEQGLKCEQFIASHCKDLLKEPTNDTARFFNCPFGRHCCVVPLFFQKRTLGFVVLCNLETRFKLLLQIISSFTYFVKSRVENFTKEEEMNIVYETLHPRALAMSTMHTVHRIISSSLDINDLVPRLTRFTLQVVKADYCAMFLLDQRKHFLLKRFQTGNAAGTAIVKQKRIRVDTGIYGKIVTTGNFHFTKKTISVPLIEDDVIGIIVVMCDGKHRQFSKVDLEILRTVSEQAVIAIKNAQLFEDHEKITTGSVESISNLLNFTCQTEETKYASLFERLVAEIGKDLKLTNDEQKNSMRAAKLLGLGEIGIPDYIRQKKGPLTQKEYAIVKKHSLKAVEIINSIESLQPIIPIILYHHERYDGSGYPHGLKGEEIPLTARILSVVIAFVAMISDRPYRPAKRFDDAVNEIISLSALHYDPYVVNAFVRVVNKKEIHKTIVSTINREGVHGFKKTKDWNSNRRARRRNKR